MKRFDEKGMMIIPNPIKEEAVKAEKVLVVKEVYCPQGHNLVSGRAVFGKYPGILLKVKKGNAAGFVALSPIYGEKCRISIDVDLKSGEICDLFCPECGIKLPIHSQCSCGAHLVALFLSPEQDFSDCIGICNRVDCTNSKILEGGQMISLSMIDKGRYI
jgi:hypothetical protein